jgi:Second Messenger Oligonucleotide or Dinucleotide Synthetase domain
MYVDRRVIARKSQLINILERLCQALELTDTQYALAKKRYEGVGEWLADAENPLLRALIIYLQGSTTLGTTVKPIGRNEHDVDLVAHMPNLGRLPPATIKRAIGSRLRENGNYAPLMEEMPRCWRLNHANEFHMDITPSIPNPECGNGGELIPDKAMQQWMASNPKGYKVLFERRAVLQPRMRLVKSESFATDGARAEIEPYPGAGGFKGILRRTIQIEKRHRDVYFAGHDPCLMPISVVITTLASRSYEYCVTRFAYDSELDVLRDIVRHMPAFIETRVIGGRQQWFIWNETTSGENFAEKWNNDPRRAEAFYGWHARALADLDKLTDLEGLDRLNKSLSESFGQPPVKMALDALTEEASAARRAGRLAVAPAIGLSTNAIGTRVRANTFFGAP